MTTTAAKSSMRIDEINVGTRHRNDLGDIEGLAASITEVGLLHPPVVNGAGELIAGARRFAAAIHLGWKTIPVTVATNLDQIEKALKAEQHENTCRKDFTPSEAVAMAKALEPFARQRASDRMHNGKPSEKVSGGEKGKARDKIAAAVGMSAPTLRKAESVVNAAKEDPETFGDLPAKMDAGGKVDPVFQEAQDRAEKLPANKRPAAVPARRQPHPQERWSKLVTDIYQLSNSIRDLGGIDKLVDGWAPGELADFASEFKQFKASVESWIEILEKQCQSKQK